jgi:hypothetical protein
LPGDRSPGDRLIKRDSYVFIRQYGTEELGLTNVDARPTWAAKDRLPTQLTVHEYIRLHYLTKSARTLQNRHYSPETSDTWHARGEVFNVRLIATS